ncbi:MAG TPA: serine/threonine-protein kinase [Isosphaeraceae bacterium]|nr:serine/threonine-protein kinase [Isosphaeraceae bacterium]
MSRLDNFVANLHKTGLLEPADLEFARAQIAGVPDSVAPVRLARTLIEKKKLTPYQARKVLSGATRGFFLGGYKILRPLGEGGMGKVYLAERLAAGLRVAIKVLPPRKAIEVEHALKRFHRETELSQRLRHPNVARTLEVGCADGVHFMVLEYIPGDSLYNIVKQSGPMRVPDTTRFFLKVLAGLEAAHEAGLVHRDIKPSNLMITPEGDARILDLGLARAMGEESALTRDNVVIGTLDYASPEQLSDAARADERSDLYSLGCTLYFTLAGRPPFEGGDVVNKIFKQRMEDPEPLERVARGVPASFAAIVRKLMAKDPEHRYQSVSDLRPDLARWTDPSHVRAILGAEADAASAFRPPPPELDDQDLRDLFESDPMALLRELGDAAPGFAPMHKPAPPPRKAVVVEGPSGGGWDWDEEAEHAVLPTRAEDHSWLIRFAVIALVLGMVAILLISFLT